MYSRSLWLRFLYDRLGRRLTVPGACLLWAAASAGLFFVVSWRQGTLLVDRTPGRLSLLEDTTALAYYLLLPLCFLLLYYSLRLFRRYLNRLEEVLEPGCMPDARNQLIAIAKESFEAGAMKTVRRILVAIGLLIFVYNAVANLYPGTFYGRPGKWDGIAHPVSYVLARLYILFVWGYAIPTWAAEVYLQLSVMVRISRTMAAAGWVKVSPYALDQFGGLGRLAEAASWVGYLILAAGVFFLAPLLRAVLWGHQLHIGNYIGFGVYVLLATAGVLLPMFLLHRLLTQKREDMLRFLSRAFDEINARVGVLVKENDIQALGDEGLGRALETVDRLRAQWAALPNWPLGLAVVVRYLVMVVPPAVVFIMQQFFTEGAP